jgi:malate:Na+ symporter
LIQGGDQGAIFAGILPMVMMSGFTSIVFSSLLNFLGKQKPHLTGEGRITPERTDMAGITPDLSGAIDATVIAATGITAVTFYLIGAVGQKLFDFPAPVAMIFIAFLMKVTNAISPQLQQGGLILQKFFATAVTYPLLFAVGVSITPWDKLISAFTFLNIVIIVFTVAVLMTTGFLVARRIHMYPIDVAVVCSCSAAQGGTSDVAILTAANRLSLLPFCSIATRVGGATMVTVALILMRFLG